MLVSAPTIARLLGRPRLWAHRQAIRGTFGAILHRRGRAYEVELAAVERALGLTFTPSQLSAAGISPHEDHHGSQA
jgi:hypothetical protein